MNVAVAPTATSDAHQTPFLRVLSTPPDQRTTIAGEVLVAHPHLFGAIAVLKGIDLEQIAVHCPLLSGRINFLTSISSASLEQRESLTRQALTDYPDLEGPIIHVIGGSL